MPPAARGRHARRSGESTGSRFRLYGADGPLQFDSWQVTGPTYELRDPATQHWTKDAARALDRGFNALVGANTLRRLHRAPSDRLPAWPEAVAALNRKRL